MFRDFETWMKGLIGAGISGATAVITVTVCVPEVFTSSSAFKKLFMVCFVSFIVSVAKYLSMHPLPSSDSMETKPK